MDYDQIDIFNHKTFLSNLSPKTSNNNSKKPQPYIDQAQNQNNNRHMSNTGTSSAYKPFTKNQFFDMQQRNQQQNKPSTTYQQPSMQQEVQRQTSCDSYAKNKENFNNSLSKIFFNSPRYKAQLNKMNDNVEPQQMEQYQVNQQDSQGKYSYYMNQTPNSLQKQEPANSALLNTPSSSYAPRREQQEGSTSIKNSTNNSYVKQKSQNNALTQEYKNSMVLTKNISLNKADSYSSTTDRLVLSSNSNQFDARHIYSSTTKNQNQYGTRPQTTSKDKRESKEYFEFQKDNKYKQNSSNRPSSGKDFSKRAESYEIFDKKREMNFSQKQNQETRKSYVQQEEQKQNSVRDQQHQQERRPNTGSKLNYDEKAEKKSAIFSSTFSSQIPRPQPPTSQSQVVGPISHSTKHNNFVEDQVQHNSHQTSQQNSQSTMKKSFAENDKQAISFEYMKKSGLQENSKSVPHTSSKAHKNVSGDKRESKFKNEYQEYKKLQEKLNFLENKIMSIKTNIDSNQKKDYLNKQNRVNSEKNNVSLKNSLNTTPNYKGQEARKNQSNRNGDQPEEYQPYSQTPQQEKPSLNSFITQVGKGSALPTKLSDSKQKPKPKPEEKQNSSSHKPYANYQPKQQSQSQSTFFQKQSQFEDEHENQTQSNKQSGKNSAYLSRANQSTMSSQSLRNSSVQTQLQRNSQQLQNQFIYYATTIVKAYVNINDQSYQMQLAREHLLQTIQAINFAKMLKPPNQKILHEKKIYLPNKKDNKKTLVFDLDETLIHCNESTSIPADVVLPIKFPTGEIIEAGINIRPYTMKCLQELSKIFELVVFTASHSCYANVVLDYLDPQGEYIQHRLFRENCVQTEEGVFIKDLRVLQNRDLKDIIIVDNAAYSFGYQIDNGLPIFPFYDNRNDIELKHLMNYVKNLVNVRDVRDYVRNSLKLTMYNEFSDPIELIKILYEDLIKQI